MKYAAEAAKATRQAKEFLCQRWVRGADYLKGKLNEHNAKKQQEPTQDRYSRRTSHATIAMAVFTGILVAVNWVQLREIQDSGVESSGQIDQMIKEMRSQVVQIKRQADDTHELAIQAKNQADMTKDVADRTKDQADRTKDLAERTKTIADQAVVQANAAKSAADTAKETLHVSERAYVTIEEPAFNFSSKSLNLPLVNSGHIPAQDMVATVHVAFYELPDATGKISAGEPASIMWQNSRYPSVGVGNHDTIALPLPLLDKDKYDSGLQLVITAGQLTYDDGFPDSQRQTWDFCFRTFYQLTMKYAFISPCDSHEFLPQLIRLDGYPNNEHHD